VVTFTHWLAHEVLHLLHVKFQPFTLNGFDAMTSLVMTYCIDKFQPEGPLYSICIVQNIAGTGRICSIGFSALHFVILYE